MIGEFKEKTTWKQYDDTYKSFAEPSIAYPLTDIGIEDIPSYWCFPKKKRKRPAPLSIADFKGLVSHLPVNQQSFTTGINRWKSYFGEHEKLASIFGERTTVEISRKDIFTAVKRGDLEKVLFLCWRRA